MGRTTLADLAKKVGVSKATASMALNNYPNIAEETRDRIVRCARQLGYLPRQRRRATAAQGAIGGTETIACVVCGVHGFESNPYYAAIVSGAMQAVRASGRHMVVCNWPVEEMERLTPPRELNQGSVGGAILAGWCMPKALTWLRGTGLAVVAVDASTQPDDCDCIKPDNYDAVTIAYRHLRELGHKRIAAVIGSLKHIDWRQKRDAYVALMAADGLRALVVDGYVGCSDAIWEEIRERGADTTAVLVTWDTGALGILSALHARGEQCPRDVSVIGIDGISVGEISAPPLTTVSTNLNAMGQLAVLQLFTRIAHPDAPVTSLMPRATLMKRASCGAPRHRK